jgi:flavin reductase (DIM6/NTAB) family NADH-FMN oxidoreductase RutF
MNEFQKAKRQKFRNFFQPSRIVLVCIWDDKASKLNVITLCFTMHAAYKPNSFAFAIEKRHYSHKLLSKGKELVVSVPGRDLANETLFCGLNSGREVDKVSALGLETVSLGGLNRQGINNALSNVICEVTHQIDNGDHDVFLCRVIDYMVQGDPDQPSLLSIGSDEKSYEVLARKGIHRIAVPKLTTTK